jgi:cation diffusion facilitator CzcD-associated flavoprotein CzcO
MRGGIGGELGYAPNTPLESVFNPGRSGDADGLAGQMSFNLFDFQPGHNITFVYGRAGAGWLLSPDFRNNDTLMEIRYQWRINKTWSMETRIRRREEIDLPPGTPDARIDDDFYLRFSGKF